MQGLAAFIDGGFGLSRLTVAPREVREPAAGEVLLRVRAASLNYRDLLVAEGKYNPTYPLPLTLGSDAVGQVVALGEGAESASLSVGDRVCPTLVQSWFSGPPDRAAVRRSLGGPLPGVFSEYAIARADSVVKVPAWLSDVEAASLPCAALTAFSALVTLSPIRADDIVFSLGAGGVAVFAIQIARALGARVLASTRDPSKRERLLALGAEAVVDTSAPGWGERARELTGGEGVHHVLDVGGGATLGESLRAVRPGGTVSILGRFERDTAVPNFMSAVMRNIRIQGVYVGHKQSFEALVALVEAHALRPVIDSVYPLARVREACERLASPQHFGKVCLAIPG